MTHSRRKVGTRAVSVGIESGFPSRAERRSLGVRFGFRGCAMTKPYSADLRVRVVEAVDEGATRQEAAERFGVSVSSAVRWHQLWRHEGSIEAKALRREPLASGGLRRGASRRHRGTIGPDAGRDCSGDAQTEDTGQPHGVVPVSGASRRHVKKKSCTLPSRSGRM